MNCTQTELHKCYICGNEEFTNSDVLWDKLITQWQLDDYETQYLNKQQGTVCTDCGANLRSISLAKAILNVYEFNGIFSDFVKSPQADMVNLLEINHAGTLTPMLEKFQHYKFISYPQFDMMDLKIKDNSFNLIVHSDTLEHVIDPIIGLSECCRILVPGGRCIFTVPIVVDRISRSREGLENSYHGTTKSSENDLIVHTEFGMDIWKHVLKSGFTQANFHCIDYPAGIAIEAKVGDEE